MISIILKFDQDSSIDYLYTYADLNSNTLNTPPEGSGQALLGGIFYYTLAPIHNQYYLSLIPRILGNYLQILITDHDSQQINGSSKIYYTSRNG